MRALLLLLAAALPACTDCPPGAVLNDEDGNCYAQGSASNGGGGDSATPTDDTGTDRAAGYTLGDPITKRFQTGEAGGQIMYEWVDAVMLSDRYAGVGGVSGMGVIDLQTGDVAVEFGGNRAYHIDTDGTWLVGSSREEQVRVYDVTDPAAPGDTPGFATPNEGPYHEDVGVDRGRIILGMHEWGARIYGPQGSLLGDLPGTDVFAVDLEGDRAVVSDARELVLWDVSDLGSPDELDRIALPGEARDLEFEAGRAAVALGGRGVGVWDVVDDAFVPRGTAPMPGMATSVALDGDTLWVGAWEQTALVVVTDDGLLTLGHEAPKFSAMGIAAKDGVALVADWYGVQVLDQQPGLAGPEIHVSKRMFFADADDDRGLVFRNDGAMDLEVSLTAPDRWTVSASSLTISPGGSEAVTVTPPDLIRGTLRWTSNDPDETSGAVELSAQDRTIGSAHEDFTLQGFVYPDETPRPYTLSDMRGKVVVLAYFALY